MILTVTAVTNVLRAGSVRWLAGVLLVVIYVMLGVGFFHAPAP